MSTNTFIRTTENLSAFYRKFPLDFFFYDEEGRAQLYILDDRVPGKTHHLIIANESERELVISDGSPVADMNPGPNNYHFELRFRPGVLSAGHFRWISAGSGDWRLRTVQWSGAEAQSADMEPGTISLYLLYTVPVRLALSGQDSILLPLHGLKADPEGGSRGSRVELRYQLMEADDSLATDPAEVDANSQYRQERLNILNQRGVKDIPLNASFKGTSTVLNDGESPNSLHLQVSNLLRNDFLPLCERTQAAPTRFVLSFDTAGKAENWALTDHDNAAAIDLAVSMTGNRGTLWHIEKETQGQTPQWILSLLEDTRLSPGEQFTIQLSGLITSMPSGFTKLYLQYENIPGYWDGMLTAVVEKSPLQYQDEYGVGDNVIQTRMGIGVNNPEEALHVDGVVKAQSLDLERGIEGLGFNDSLRGEVAGSVSIELIASSGNMEFNGDVIGFKIGTGTDANGNPTEIRIPTVEINSATGDMSLDGRINSNHTTSSNKANFSLNANSGSLDFQGLVQSNQQSGGDRNIKLDAGSGEIVFKSKVRSGGTQPKAELDGTNGILSVSSKIKLGHFELQEVNNTLQIKDTNDTTQTGGFIPTGGIIMWSGFRDAIPNGWAECNGLNNTPDLRGRFIVGQSNSDSHNRGYSNSEKNRNEYRDLGDRGGERKVTLTKSEMPAHRHNYQEFDRSVRPQKSGEKEAFNGGGSSNSNRYNLRWWGRMQTQGSNQPHENRPPFYVVAFIMKL